MDGDAEEATGHSHLCPELPIFAIHSKSTWPLFILQGSVRFKQCFLHEALPSCPGNEQLPLGCSRAQLVPYLTTCPSVLFEGRLCPLHYGISAPGVVTRFQQMQGDDQALLFLRGSVFTFKCSRRYLIQKTRAHGAARLLLLFVSTHFVSQGATPCWGGSPAGQAPEWTLPLPLAIPSGQNASPPAVLMSTWLSP